jgi:UDP-GlcNAc:undecaprenyl-phosphate GlcNAc-1-phosphate transferase
MLRDFLSAETAPVLAVLFTLFLSWFLTRWMIGLAPRFGLVDLPDARKSHQRPTPRAGGIAVFVAFALGMVLFAGISAELGLAALVAILGLCDDYRPVPWPVRLGGHLLIAGFAVWWLLPEMGWAVRVVSVLWIAGLVNAFNMLDNMDWLSPGVAWWTLVAGLIPLAWQHDRTLVLPGLLLAGALVGFLWWNRPPALIFLGDAGSTLLGFLLGLWSLRLTLPATSPETVAACVLVLGVPWYDLVTVVTIRLAQGRSPFHADRQHLSHRLVALGFSSRNAVLLIHALTLASVLAGLLCYGMVGTREGVVIALGAAFGWLAILILDGLLFRRRQRITRESGEST